MPEDTIREMVGGFKRVNNPSFPLSIPIHVLARIDALSFSQDRVWYDLSWEITNRTASGKATLFTEAVVIQAEWHGTPMMGAGEPGRETVKVRMWSRQLLTSVSIDPDPESSVQQNQSWFAITEDPGEWFQGARVRFDYSDQTIAPLILPSERLSSPGLQQQFTKFVAEAYNDLVA